MIRLVQYRQWFIPANSKSYQTLTNIGFPSTKIHTDSRGVLTLVLKKKGLQAHVTPFNDTLKLFQSKAKAWWMSKPGRTYALTSKVMSFKTVHKSARDDARIDALKMKAKLEEFLNRWGFAGEVIYSESKGLCKVRVEFKFSTTRNPVIQIKNPAHLSQKAILELGTHRLRTAVDKKYYHWWLDTKSGDNWSQITSGRCLVTEVTDPTAFLQRLSFAFNADTENLVSTDTSHLADELQRMAKTYGVESGLTIYEEQKGIRTPRFIVFDANNVELGCEQWIKRHARKAVVDPSLVEVDEEHIHDD